MNRNLFVTFCVGISLGFGLAYFWLKLSIESQSIRLSYPQNVPINSKAFSGKYRPLLVHNSTNYTKNEEPEPEKKPIRILCWIMTGPSNHKTKAKAVKETWGKHCDTLLFMSTQEDSSLPTVVLNVTEGYSFLWGKTKHAFNYAYEHYRDEADWFVKADDDTFMVIENLRYMLQPYDKSLPIFFGCKFSYTVQNGYMSGGAGYVLSSEALRRLIVEGLNNETICKQGEEGYEDVEMGLCMQNLNVTAGDSRDEQGRGRFFAVLPEQMLVPDLVPKGFWFFGYSYYPVETGADCCSDSAVSYHYIGPNMMYIMNYLVYHFKVDGLNSTDWDPAENQTFIEATEKASITSTTNVIST